MNKEDYEKILDHARNGLPNEACGLIGGVIEKKIKVVKEVYLLRNVDESKEHFSMNPAEQLKAVKDLRAKGYLLFGNFHSHPESPSRPSEEDKRLAYDPEASYLILSLLERDKPVLKAFNIIGGTVSEEQIELV
jgi:proteasome lid subunit RPN8/RPN11